MINPTAAGDWMWQQALRGLRPEPDLKVWEWADAHRHLSSAVSPEEGPWRTSRVPYTREIMEALSTNSGYTRVVFMKGSQIAGTEVGNNWLGSIIDSAPGPTLYALDSLTTAKKYSKTRIDQMIRDCPTLRDKVRDARSRDSGNTILLKEFNGGYLVITGANSPSGLRGSPIRYLYLDEIDEFPGNIGGEGDPVYLALVRTRNFSRRKKEYLCSSPTIEGESRIAFFFEQSDQRFFYVPCPHCLHHQRLQWKQVKWDKSLHIAEQHLTAYYECEECKGHILNHQKTEMLERGEWRKHHPGSEIAGFHLSALYSPVGWFSWSDAVKQFLESKDKPELLKVFVNTVLGETWKEKVETPEWEILFSRRENYKLGTVPGGGLFLTAGVDVQKDRLECEVWAWGRGKESWSIDVQVIPGEPHDRETWKRLDDFLNEHFQHESGIMMPIQMLAIDSGSFTQEVYNWARKYPTSRVMAIKGRDSMSVILGKPTPVDVTVDGRRISKGVKLWTVGVSILKAEFYGFLKLRRPEKGEPFPEGYCHFPDHDEEYFRQIASEQLVEISKKGGRRKEWKTLRDRNEALDRRNYARAAAAAVGIDRFTERIWTRLESQFQNVPPQPEGKAPPSLERAAPEARPRKKRRILSKGISE